MDAEFNIINIGRDFDKCLHFRRDAYYCSFNTFDGFSGFSSGYQENMSQRLDQAEWFYIHVWFDNNIIGQLEFRSVSEEAKAGYVNLIYLRPEYRGKGWGGMLHHFIVKTLLNAGCERAILSVSKTNSQALRFYGRLGWEYLSPNPKHELTDYYQLKLSAKNTKAGRVEL